MALYYTGIINTVKGAKAIAVMYSISETAKLNNLNSYYYFMHLLSMMPKLMDEQGNIEISKLDSSLP